MLARKELIDNECLKDLIKATSWKSAQEEIFFQIKAVSCDRMTLIRSSIDTQTSLLFRLQCLLKIAFGKPTLFQHLISLQTQTDVRCCTKM